MQPSYIIDNSVTLRQHFVVFNLPYILFLSTTEVEDELKRAGEVKLLLLWRWTGRSRFWSLLSSAKCPWARHLTPKNWQQLSWGEQETTPQTYGSTHRQRVLMKKEQSWVTQQNIVKRVKYGTTHNNEIQWFYVIMNDNPYLSKVVTGNAPEQPMLT